VDTPPKNRPAGSATKLPVATAAGTPTTSKAPTSLVHQDAPSRRPRRSVAWMGSYRAGMSASRCDAALRRWGEKHQRRILKRPIRRNPWRRCDSRCVDRTVRAPEPRSVQFGGNASIVSPIRASGPRWHLPSTPPSPSPLGRSQPGVLRPTVTAAPPLRHLHQRRPQRDREGHR